LLLSPVIVTRMAEAQAVASSPFRCAIPNPKRYTKANSVSLEKVAEAAYEGDYAALESMLATGDADHLFNGDLNKHVTSITALHMAAMTGMTECVELLLQAKADPHVKENVSYGEDPEEAKTAMQYAKEFGWDDTAAVLQEAEKSYPYGYYVPAGQGNNSKVYGGFEWGKKPAKGWYLGRPGASTSQGIDPSKYGDPGMPEIKSKGTEEDMEPIAAPAEPPLPIGLLFPGQGSQYVKMMSTVKDIPKVKEYISKADAILPFKVLDICMNGPEAKLEETSICQPAMFIAGLAGIEKLRGEREEAVTRCQVLAGLSLGEYTALCHAGVFEFEDGLRLVMKRGEAMASAASVGKQAMLSVAGLDEEKLKALCKEAQAAEGSSGVCQIANSLFPKGYSCAGTETAILKLKDLAEGAGALQAKVLKTSGGFHTSLMEPAQRALGKILDEMLTAGKIKSPKFTVYMNATAEPCKPGAKPAEIVELLKKQLTNPVLWEPSVRAMIKEGVTEFYEVGPMKQIKAMMKRIDSKVWGKTTNVEV